MSHRDSPGVLWTGLLLLLYSEGCWLTVRTDYEALIWITNMTNCTGALARWSIRISKFKFDVIHRSGMYHQADDALSRLKTTGTNQLSIDDEVPVLCPTASISPGKSRGESYVYAGLRRIKRQNVLGFLKYMILGNQTTVDTTST